MVLAARLKKLLHPGILVRVTNLGLGFILLTLVVAVAATNTGNNGLYILVSLFLGALVVSGIVSRRNVENVAVELNGPAEIFAGVPVRFTLRLTNLGRLPRRGLLVKISSASAPILFGRLNPGRPAEHRQGRLGGGLSAQGALGRDAGRRRSGRRAGRVARCHDSEWSAY